MSKMQKIQNRATRFITNTRLIDHITSEELHRRTDLEPINIILHKQAQQIWNSIETNVNPSSLTKLAIEEDRTFTQYYPSSKISAFARIDPQYL